MPPCWTPRNNSWKGLRKYPQLTNVRSTNLDDATELRLHVDDRKAAALGLAYGDINSTLSTRWAAAT